MKKYFTLFLLSCLFFTIETTLCSNEEAIPKAPARGKHRRTSFLFGCFFPQEPKFLSEIQSTSRRDENELDKKNYNNPDTDEDENVLDEKVHETPRPKRMMKKLNKIKPILKKSRPLQTDQKNDTAAASYNTNSTRLPLSKHVRFAEQIASELIIKENIIEENL